MQKIESVKSVHLEQVFGIEQLSNSTPWSYSSFIDCYNKNYEFYVCTENNKVLGFFIANINIFEAHLLNISVAPAYKRRGIGTTLLKKFESSCLRYGVQEVFLEVRRSNVDAQNFYLRYEFNEVGIRKNYYKLPEGREDGIIFSKKINTRSWKNYLKQFFYICRNIFRLRIW